MIALVVAVVWFGAAWAVARILGRAVQIADREAHSEHWGDDATP